jgi:hypothetical protein
MWDSPLLFVLFGAVAAAVAYLGWRHEQQRRQALRQFAADRGWRFVDRDDTLAGQLRGDFPLFREGDGGRHCRNVLHARTRSGRECLLFDYSYQVRRRSTGNNGTTTMTTRTIRHAVAAVTLPAWLPELRLARENVLTKLAGAVGFGDIEVESTEFNRRFRVRAADRGHAFDVLHPRTIDFLLSQPLDSWELAGGRLLVARDGRWSIGEYDGVVAQLERFVDLVPDYVWRKHGVVPG